MNTKQAIHYPSFTAAQLKALAVISMTVDHTAAALIDKTAHHTLCTSMRGFGRLAFPIFAFFLVEGFLHTRDLKKYALRLAIFAIISEVPFDLMLKQDPIYILHQNTICTLFLGLLSLAALKAIAERDSLGRWKPLLSVLSTTAFCGIAWLGKTDYSWFGILLITVLYFYRNDKRLRMIMGASLSLCYLYAALAFIPLYFYNGERGRQNKYFFYIYYPAHLLLLGLLALVL